MGFHSTSFRFEGGGRRIIALKRSGKSCRLRWVNYLNPSLKRGKITPNEEKLVLELHSKWGNRWSRIARSLPGRTDNEIKNYWRTLMRKSAQEKKRAIPPSSPSSNCCSSSSLSSSSNKDLEKTKAKQEVCSMDDIWKDITSSEEPISPLCEGRGSNFACTPLASPFWEYCADTPWKMGDEEESKMFFSIDDPFLPC